MRLIRSLLVAASLAAVVQPALSQERAIIVLDGSGSMWGRIDEVPKITIARDVLAEVLQTVPGELSLGLMAYGHREKGNCADIEMVVPVGDGTAAAIAGAARDISPKGKTPLTDAVRRAAEELGYTEDKATVILITDGIETCRADPCALARELEATGVAFTAHVVGFGLSAEEGRQVACIAEETGGVYIQADNAQGLSDALTDTVEQAAVEEPAPAPEPVEEVEVAALPTASLEAPDQIEIGRRYTITWDGPGERYDDVYLFDPEANNGEGKRLRGRRLVNAEYDRRQLTLVAPARPGVYELHYYYGAAHTVIATRPIEVIEAAVSLSAPATISMGRRFKVEWVGPGARRDDIEVYDPEAKQGAGARLHAQRVVNGDFDNRIVELVAPAEPGFYRLRYWNGDNNTVLATREIEVLEAPVGLTGPDSVPIGSIFTVGWEGPGGRQDAVHLVDEAADKILTNRRLANDDYEGHTVSMVAPATPGTYLLRYYNGENRAVLASLPLTVVDAEVGLEAPDEVAIAHTFDVVWTGPGARRDSVQLYDPAADAGRGKVVYSKRTASGDTDARTVQMIATAKPGELLLRYWNGDSGKVLAERPVRIVAMDVSIEAPDAVDAGATFDTVWAGPGAYRDAVQIYDPAASAGRGKVIAARRLANGDYDNRKAALKAPDAPGSYVLRYWNGDYGTVLAERPITVR